MNKKFYSNKENQIIFNLTKLMLSIQPLNCYFIFITIFVDYHLLNTLCFKLVFYGVYVQITLLLQAVGLFINHVSPFPGHIQLLASAIAPAVRAVSDTSSSRLINVTKANIIRNVESLRVKTPIIDSYHDEKKIRVVGGLYHLKTGIVEVIA